MYSFMLLNSFTFHAPTSLTEAVKLYGSLENAKLQAGGTFLLNALKLIKRKGTKAPSHVISLSKVTELKGILIEADELVIRAMTTIDEIYDSPLLTDNFAILKTVCRNISTQPIRNMATIGGNLTCRYTWTEMPAVMIGLEAKMHFVDTKGNEEILEAEEFYKRSAKTDKIFTHVSIPKDTRATIVYRRARKSQFVDIPLFSIFIKTTFKENQFTNTRVSVNNCVAFAQRDTKLEEFLNANAAQKSEKIAEEALDHLDDSIYDTRSDDYKKYMFRMKMKSAINELSGVEETPALYEYNLV